MVARYPHYLISEINTFFAVHQIYVIFLHDAETCVESSIPILLATPILNVLNPDRGYKIFSHRSPHYPK